MTDRIAEKLVEARALIERGWTQGADSRNEAGDDLTLVGHELQDAVAVCWCVAGAIYRVKNGVSYSRLAAAFRTANEIEDIIDWNDAPGRTKAEVLAAFDKAIELARVES